MSGEVNDKPKYSGYGYHGGGRKKLSESGRIRVQFSLQQNEIDLIKELAEKAGLNNSRFIMECVKFWKENH
ncbi:MAG: hypothetical protein IJJ70_07790 [Treponema sp.]|nr:hypothetical protein [bacterium]MBQ5998057.1 hypothetical protein [Treponema sp.]MBQ6056130.1 hypothetical protein [Treponema sp.]MBR0487583.1 hypothetical protein [Treponema sp.]